jgi:RHS repeat-associated protein
MPSLPDPHRPVCHEETTKRFSRSSGERLLAECVLSVWVIYIPALGRLRSITLRIAHSVRNKPLQRRLVCLVVVFNLLLWPGPGLATKRAIAATLLVAKNVEARVSRIVKSDEAYLLASFVSDSINGKGLYVSTNSAAVVASMFLQSGNSPHHQTMAERAAAVAKIRLSPIKFVSYQDSGAAFSAIATDSQGHTVHGVKFTYASSNEAKLQVDPDSGQAKFLSPGLARVICRAGTVETSAPVLIRPGHRSPQTDAEWRADQAALGVDGSVRGDSGLPPDDTLAGAGTRGGPSILNHPSSILDTLSSIFDKLSPTAEAQSGGGSANDQLWSDPRNLVGNPRNRVIEPMRLGSVLPESSNFNLAMPILGLGGRGLATNLMLYYNSRGNSSWPAAGFSLGFGQLVLYDGGWIGGTYVIKYMWVEPDGTRHYLGIGAWETFGWPQSFETTDGSHIVYSGDGSRGGNLYYPDGTHLTINVVNNVLVPTMVNDRNGNYIQIAYKTEELVECCGTDCWCDVWYPSLSLDYVVDTLGRTFTFQYYLDNYGNPTGLASISGPPGFGGAAPWYAPKLVQFYYSGSTGLNKIYYPATGTGYVFTYSGFGMISGVSLRRQMSVDFFGNLLNGLESASVSFLYQQSPTPGAPPVLTQRTETAVNAPTAVYNYSPPDSTYLPNALTFAITRPEGSTLYLSRSTDTTSPANGLLVQSELKSGATSLAKSKFAYVNDGGGSPQAQSVTSFDDTGTATKADFDYDQYGNVTNKREYGTLTNGTWQVRRRTHYTYNPAYLGNYAYLRGLVSLVEVFDALQDSNDANDVLIAKTSYLYDGGLWNYGAPYPPGYLTLYNSLSTRGNVMGITQWTDIAAGTTIQRSATYDIYGNLIKATVSCCQEKDLTLTQNTYWSNAESVMSGDPNGAHTTTYTDYDFNSSLPKSATDAGGLTTTLGYDAALNPNYAGLPTGATATAGYDYGNLKKTSTVTYTDGTDDGTFGTQNPSSKTITTSGQYDGWWRVIQSVDRNGGQVNMTYDAMGRVASRTNPFPAGGTPGPATTFQYDALGRTTVTTLPDGNTVQNTYSGSTVTAIDQVGRKIKREVDGLGRLIKVTEQDVAAGLLTQETTYSYNLLDKLTGVNQGGQTRAYKYDAIGRLLYERIPEQTATINDGTGTMWSCKYTYTEFGGVATKQDARGVITTFTYDALHHVTQKSYNTTGAPGVAATSSVTFTWASSDAVSSVSTGAYGESTTFDAYGRPASMTETIDGRSYTTSYQYNGGGQPATLTHPSGYVVNFSYDVKGRLSGMPYNQQYPTLYGGLLSGVTYNVAGQVTAMGLGSGAGYYPPPVIQENFTYDSNRLQLTSQVATRVGGPTGGLMNLTYNYQAQAGQMGAGTTVGNAGQLMSISGTINGTTETANYTYDDLGRLVTSSQTSNGARAQRRFAYDRWGNRTQVYDATSGGTLIQNTAWYQDGGVTTNRLAVVSDSSVGYREYTYDAAGNVTNDLVHTYQYDAENRLVSVDGGATATYSYDHQNRRIKKTIGSTVTHYVWQGSQVLAEHNGSTGVVLSDSIHLGSRMIAKVSGGATQYFLSDRLSERLVLDGYGNVIGRQGHLPFGEDLAESGTQDRHHFTSYERDAESGTDYGVNRMYSPTTGRFGQADPYEATGYMIDPQSWNRYSYTANEPVNRLDPSGLSWITGMWLLPGGGLAVWTCDKDVCWLDYRLLPISENEQKYQNVPKRSNIDDLRRKFAKALSLALKALTKDACKGLFDTSKFNPQNLLVALSEDNLGSIPGIAPGTLGSISFEPLTDSNGDPIPGTSALTTQMLGRNANGQSTFLGVAIYINSDPNAPWTRGFNDAITNNQDIRRAVTLIHELGHAADYLFGTGASQIGDDLDDAKKSRENSKLVYDNCFK